MSVKSVDIYIIYKIYNIYIIATLLYLYSLWLMNFKTRIFDVKVLYNDPDSTVTVFTNSLL